MVNATLETTPLAARAHVTAEPDAPRRWYCRHVLVVPAIDPTSGTLLDMAFEARVTAATVDRPTAKPAILSARR
jgi:hypothetical protein